jgi:hypothetical protein
MVPSCPVVYLGLAMTNDNEQYAYLTVIGEFSPETITAQLDLKPSDAARKGDLNEKTLPGRKFSRRSLHSGKTLSITEKSCEGCSGTEITES